MKIAVVGAGYVGLTLAAILTDQGHQVWLLRKDKEKNKALKKGQLHIFEPGLTELVKKNLKTGRLIPTLNYKEAIPPAKLIFICVGTPPDTDGKADLTQVLTVAKDIGKNLLAGLTVVAVKSTVPPGTTEKIAATINKYKRPKARIAISFCPEFLREGSAVQDSLHPDRVIIGSTSPVAIRLLKKIHQPFKAPILITRVNSAELIKYAANNYLALRIVFINQVADLCEKMNADIQEVIQGIGLDRRIGLHYWYPGLGYGGSCFPKDVAALAWFAKEKGFHNSLFAKMNKLNHQRLSQQVRKIEEKFGSLSRKRVAVLGLAVKQGTDDVRCSPAMTMLEILLKKGAEIQAFDPLAMENARQVLPKVKFCLSSYQATKGVDCLLLLNDWPEFSRLDYAKIKKMMRGNFIFDSRNLLVPEKMTKLGFDYLGVGR